MYQICNISKIRGLRVNVINLQHKGQIFVAFLQHCNINVVYLQHN